MADLQSTTVDGTLVYRVPVDVKTSSYTLALTDSGKVIEFNNSSGATITIPPNSSVPFPIGTKVYICFVGSATLTLAAGSGVTLSRSGGFGVNEEIYLRKRATDSWIVVDSPKNLSASASVSSTQSAGYEQFTFTSTGSGNTFTVD